MIHTDKLGLRISQVFGPGTKWARGRRRGALWPSRGRARCSFRARDTRYPSSDGVGVGRSPLRRAASRAGRCPGLLPLPPAAASLWNAGVGAPQGAFDPRRVRSCPTLWCWARWLRGGGSAGRPRGSLAPPKRPLCFGGAGPWALGAERADHEECAVSEPLASPRGSSPCPWRAPGGGALHALHTAQASSEMTNFHPTCAAHEDQVSVDPEAFAVPEPMAVLRMSV